jgi:hypothetical protein
MTGVGATFFMASAERLLMHRFHVEIPFRKVVDRFLARPFCFLASHTGYGTDMTIYATKRNP